MPRTAIVAGVILLLLIPAAHAARPSVGLDTETETETDGDGDGDGNFDNEAVPTLPIGSDLLTNGGLETATSNSAHSP